MDSFAVNPTTSARIDLLHGSDVAHWCRVFGVDMRELRQAVQQVGPQAQAVHDYLVRQRATQDAPPMAA